MNERLKELMLEAGYAAPELALRAQKLAELIVKECITTIEQDRFQKADLLETEYDDGYVDGMGRAERTLKEHFGVER
jgi:hypothetical protein